MSREPGEPPKSVADQIPFFDVAKLLERVYSRSGTEKLSILSHFFDHYRRAFMSLHKTLETEQNGDSLYPIVRIFMAKDDRGRTAYGFKAHTLGRIYAKVLGLNDKNPDGKKLYNYKNPEKSGLLLAGDLGSVFYKVLENRQADQKGQNSPSLREVHDALDQIASNFRLNGTNSEKQREILQKLVRRLTAIEGKWLTRILLKDLFLGISDDRIWKLVHPQARELFDKTTNLETICLRLNDPAVHHTNIDISLFQHFRAMLCTRVVDLGDGSRTNDLDFDSGDEGQGEPSTGAKKKGKKLVSIPDPPIYLQTKWDGERFQIHFSVENGQERWVYFSRRGHDYSDHFNAILTPALKQQMNQGVNSFIMDGEMMAWQKEMEAFTMKGSEVDVKTLLPTNPKHTVVFVAFDVLYLNGEILTERLLRERGDLLHTVFEPKKGVALISKMQYVENDKNYVKTALNKAIDDLEEGLILKLPNSTYQPGQRNENWLKIKPEFFSETSVDDLDLLILGAYYSDSDKRNGLISHLLVGVVQEDRKDEYFAVTGLGSGCLKIRQMRDLIHELDPYFTLSPSKNVHYKGFPKPDRYINPIHSIVVSVKGSEITRNHDIELGYTIRFPRITDVRRDKNYDEVLTVKQFHEIREGYGGKLVRKTDGSKPNFVPPLKRKAKEDEEDEDTDDEEESRKSKAKKQTRKDFYFASNFRGRAQQALPAIVSSSTSTSTNNNSLWTGPKSFSQLLKEKKERNAKGQVKKPESTSTKKLPASSLPKMPESKASVNKDIFQSKIFCVIGVTNWKPKTEEKIKEFGGKIVANPNKDTFCVLSEKSLENSPIAASIAKKGQVDIVSKIWFENCLESGKMLDLTPPDFFFMTDATKHEMDDKSDKYGDSYTEPNDSETNKKIVGNIMKELEEKEDDGVDVDSGEDDISYIKNEVQKEFTEEDRRELQKYSFLEGCYIAFRGPFNNKLIRAKTKFYGGRIAVNEFIYGVTHAIVIDEKNPPPETNTTANTSTSRIHVVNLKWLQDSLDKGARQEESLYNPYSIPIIP